MVAWGAPRGGPSPESRTPRPDLYSPASTGTSSSDTLPTNNQRIRSGRPAAIEAVRLAAELNLHPVEEAGEIHRAVVPLTRSSCSCATRVPTRTNTVVSAVLCQNLTQQVMGA